MVGQVEKLGAKLKVGVLRGAEFLEEGEIETMEARPPELARPTAERAVVGLADRGSHGRTGKCRGIEPVIHIVRTRIQVFTGNAKSIATKPGGRGANAR